MISFKIVIIELRLLYIVHDFNGLKTQRFEMI